MFGEERDDSAGQRGQRAYSYAVVVSADDSTEQTDAISEGEEFKNVAVGVSRFEEKILGAAFVGDGIFLQNGGYSDGGTDQGVHRASRRRRLRCV
jgi:hypothetical protein